MNYNSIPPFSGASIKDLHETVGVTQQPVGSDTGWFQTIGGLLIQGDIAVVDPTAFLTVFFLKAYTKNALGVWLQTIGNHTLPAPASRNDYAQILDLTKFEISNDYVVTTGFYWWAIGY